MNAPATMGDKFESCEPQNQVNYLQYQYAWSDDDDITKLYKECIPVLHAGIWF